MQKIISLFKEIADSDMTLSPFVQPLAGDVLESKHAQEDFEVFTRLIAQIVAKPLAGMTPGSV